MSGRCKIQRKEAYLVAKTLRGNNRNLVAQALVGLKVERELGVVTLDHHLGGPLDGLFFCIISMAFSFSCCTSELTLVLTRPMLTVVGCWRGCSCVLVVFRRLFGFFCAVA